MLILIYAYIGLVIGSFVDAAAWRLHKKLNPQRKSGKQKQNYSIISGRSMCENCHHQLGARDLIPVVSWLSLGGKCRYCSHKISWQSPLIELASSVLFVGLFVYFPHDISTSDGLISLIFWSVYLIFLILLSVYDFRHLILPDILTKPLAVLALLQILLLAIVNYDLEPMRQSLLGLMIGFGFFYGLFFVSKGKWIGGGDVKYSLFMGLVLGPSKTIIGLAIAFYLATFVILPLLVFGVINRKSKVPFGPFLILATLLAFLFGDEIIDWYNSSFIYL